MDAPGLQEFSWNEIGYKPLVFSHDWMVAVLNWEPLFEKSNLGEIERHNQTDEVFILVKGHALLFVVTPAGMLSITDMVPGVVCNVRQGCWHGLLSSRDVQIVIVENRDTHLGDSEFRQLSPEERDVILGATLSWME